MAAKFELYKDASDKYRFRLKAANGEVVASGQAYSSKDGARGGIEAVRKAAAAATVDDQA